MKNSYYNLPLSLGHIVDGKQHLMCNAAEGIYQHIYLILVSFFDETRYDSSYGCALWDQDFTIMTSLKWKELIRDSVKESLQRFEHRITNIKIQVELDEFEIMTKSEHYVRKRIGIGVEAVIRQTNEPFRFFERIYISPMSQEQ